MGYKQLSPITNLSFQFNTIKPVIAKVTVPSRVDRDPVKGALEELETLGNITGGCTIDAVVLDPRHSAQKDVLTILTKSIGAYPFPIGLSMNGWEAPDGIPVAYDAGARLFKLDSLGGRFAHNHQVSDRINRHSYDSVRTRCPSYIIGGMLTCDNTHLGWGDHPGLPLQDVKEVASMANAMYVRENASSSSRPPPPNVLSSLRPHVGGTKIFYESVDTHTGEDAVSSPTFFKLLLVADGFILNKELREKYHHSKLDPPKIRDILDLVACVREYGVARPKE